MNLGFIGFGEVGFELAGGLKKAGVPVIWAFDPMADDPTFGKLVQDRVKEAGVVLLPTPGEVVRKADIIIASAPGSKALQAA
jgi:3-hydroxyisobutyrate dehydrogenase-like beta-hydroxyacid dehydrogenase